MICTWLIIRKKTQLQVNKREGLFDDDIETWGMEQFCAVVIVNCSNTNVIQMRWWMQCAGFRVDPILYGCNFYGSLFWFNLLVLISNYFCFVLYSNLSWCLSDYFMFYWGYNGKVMIIELIVDINIFKRLKNFHFIIYLLPKEEFSLIDKLLIFLIRNQTRETKNK